MEKGLTLDQLREELRKAIRESSGRAVARELNVSPTGLLKFVETAGSGKRVASSCRGMSVGWPNARLEAPEAEAVGPSVAILARDMAPQGERRVRKEIARMV
jgi:hypothetical protein